MDPSEFTAKTSGDLVASPLGYLAFVPASLPPALELTWRLARKVSEADRAVAALGGLAHNLPNPHLLIAPFIRREAVLSSRIEGTQASLSDLFYFEAGGAGAERVSDVREVANYVRALEYGLGRLRDLPLSLRLIRELHEQLMRGVRGETMTPGEFRRTQNWIGPAGARLDEATYVPPPVPQMHEALAALEKYLHEPSPLPPLVRLPIVHYQFEAIHPFLDGNGRIGRLLISLMLCHDGLLAQPLLYLSAYFEQNRSAYYDRLLAVSRRGEWSQWLEFFLEGVATQARDAMTRTERLLALWRGYRQKLETARSSALLLRLVDALFQSPMITVAGAARLLGVTHRAATLNIEKMVKAGILAETTGRERSRVYAAREVIEAVETPSADSPARG